MFSRRTTVPGRAAASLFASAISAAHETTSLSNSPRRFATGVNDNSGVKPFFGRPRCASMTIEAAFLRINSIVGSEAKILPGSVISPFFKGTLRSQRRITRFPVKSIDSRVCMVEVEFPRGIDQQIAQGLRGDLNIPIRCRTNQRPSHFCQSLSSAIHRRYMSADW